MHTRQTTLTDDPDDQPPTTTDDTCADDILTSVSHAESGDTTALAPPERRGGKHCCPWCLAAPETFEHREDGRVRCGHCDASIPIGAEWYERGEKIVV